MKISVVFSILLLTGCTAAEPEIKEWSAIGGSKGDGVVKLAYQKDFFNNSEPSYSGIPLAEERCKGWGYGGAIEFEGQSTQCDDKDKNIFGDCLVGKVVKEYQCIN